MHCGTCGVLALAYISVSLFWPTGNVKSGLKKKRHSWKHNQSPVGRAEEDIIARIVGRQGRRCHYGTHTEDLHSLSTECPLPVPVLPLDTLSVSKSVSTSDDNTQETSPDRDEEPALRFTNIYSLDTHQDNKPIAS